MTALPTFLAGQEPTAGQWQTLLPLFARKTSDQTVNNSATFQNDNAIFVSVAANAVYDCHFHFIFNSGATPSLKTQFTAPSGATMTNWTFFLPNGSGVAVESIANTAAGVNGITCNGTDLPGDYFGLLITGANAGTFQLQWAQTTANASNTILRATSYLILRQVA